MQQILEPPPPPADCKVFPVWYVCILIWCDVRQEVNDCPAIFLGIPSTCPFRRPSAWITGCNQMPTRSSNPSNHMTCVGSMLAHRLRRWPSIKPAPVQHLTAYETLKNETLKQCCIKVVHSLCSIRSS